MAMGRSDDELRARIDELQAADESGGLPAGSWEARVESWCLQSYCVICGHVLLHVGLLKWHFCLHCDIA